MSAVGTIASATAAIKRLHTFIENVELVNGEKEIASVEQFDFSNIALKFENVFVKYSDKSPYVLENLSFETPCRGLVAITGPSGIGKTTIALTVIKLLKPKRGRVLFNSVNISTLDEKYLREHLVTLVLQNSPLYGKNVREAITLGRNIDDRIIISWLHRLNLDTFLNNFKAGLDSTLSDVIAQASVGQIQRLSLIRGILRETPILILDEPTSNLDNDSENIVSQVIREISIEKLVLVISHRKEPTIGAIERINLGKE